MIAGAGSPTGDPGPALYELIVSGTIGPVVRSCFPDFSSRPLTAHSVLTGSCADPAQLQRLLDLLDANGSPPSVIYLGRPDGRNAIDPPGR